MVRKPGILVNALTPGSVIQHGKKAELRIQFDVIILKEPRKSFVKVLPDRTSTRLVPLISNAPGPAVLCSKPKKNYTETLLYN